MPGYVTVRRSITLLFDDRNGGVLITEEMMVIAGRRTVTPAIVIKSTPS